MANNDGCSATCIVETGYTCNVVTGAKSTCTSSCGDGKKAFDEGCDDGDQVAGDGCSATCTIETNYVCTVDANSKSICEECGDSNKDSNEECDDGNITPSDGCSATCKVEPGYTCATVGAACTTTCGDGKKSPN